MSYNQSENSSKRPKSVCKSEFEDNTTELRVNPSKRPNTECKAEDNTTEYRENPPKRPKIEFKDNTTEYRENSPEKPKIDFKAEDNTTEYRENPPKKPKIEFKVDDNANEIRVDVLDHIICNPGQLVGSYKVEKTLGEGGFGRVLLATDIISGKSVALKMLKNEDAKRKTGLTEISALKSISCFDPDDESLCIKMLDYFINDTYIGIVFPLMGLSVFDYLKIAYDLPIEEVQDIAQQLCKAVDFLHRNGMTHTDLKPENIMFVNSDFTSVYDPETQSDVMRLNCTDIRLIDFGFLTRDKDEHSVVNTTGYYRSPEILLDLGWSHPCDVWAIGCILVEIYNGSPLFDAHEDRQHLAIMEKTLGPIPATMATASKTKHFKDGVLDWIWVGWEGQEKELAEYYMPLIKYKVNDSDDETMLFDLVAKMLEYEQTKRIPLAVALEHPFFDTLT